MPVNSFPRASKVTRNHTVRSKREPKVRGAIGYVGRVFAGGPQSERQKQLEREIVSSTFSAQSFQLALPIHQPQPVTSHQPTANSHDEAVRCSESPGNGPLGPPSNLRLRRSAAGASHQQHEELVAGRCCCDRDPHHRSAGSDLHEPKCRPGPRGTLLMRT